MTPKEKGKEVGGAKSAWCLNLAPPLITRPQAAERHSQLASRSYAKGGSYKKKVDAHYQQTLLFIIRSK